MAWKNLLEGILGEFVDCSQVDQQREHEKRLSVTIGSTASYQSDKALREFKKNYARRYCAKVRKTEEYRVWNRERMRKLRAGKYAEQERVRARELWLQRASADSASGGNKPATEGQTRGTGHCNGIA